MNSRPETADRPNERVRLYKDKRVKRAREIGKRERERKREVERKKRNGGVRSETNAHSPCLLSLVCLPFVGTDTRRVYSSFDRVRERAYIEKKKKKEEFIFHRISPCCISLISPFSFPRMLKIRFPIFNIRRVV